MLNDLHNSEWKTQTWYELCFDDGRNNGLGFPCDEQGNLLTDNPAALANYRRALQCPEKYARFNKVVKYESDYREPAWGICDCGERVQLVNEYMGACECPGCGQWYNLFGQELNRPETWPDGDDW